MTAKDSEDNREQTPDIWANGKNYEAYIGRWSRLIAVEFLDWLDQPPGLSWLDMGCGTGMLTRTILTVAAPAEIAGVDPSEGFLGLAREQVRDERVKFVVGDARELPFEAAAFEVAVSGLVLNFIPEPALALAEIRRVLKPGGLFAAYVWDYAEKMEMLRLFWETAAALDPAVTERNEVIQFKLCQPAALEELFKEGGFEGVEVRGFEVPTVFRDFDDYWQPFLGGQGPGPAYVRTLDETSKEGLRLKLQQTLPTGADGSIHLTARAWAVRGRSEK